MTVRSLGYVGVDSARLEDWADFGSAVIGMEVVPDTGDSVHLRQDDRFSRWIVLPSDREGMGFIGWEVDDAAAIDDVRRALAGAGVESRDGTDDERAERRVEGLLVAADPAGNRIEFFHGQTAGETFTPGRELSGFRTGDLGMGHLVLEVPDPRAEVAFYTDALGFRLSDHLKELLFFLRCNPRHHSIGIAHVGGQPRLLHVMLEVDSLEDVGKAFDLALERKLEMSTLGVHTNDHMHSFYMRTPSGFEIEYGYGGLVVDDATWETTAIELPSIWGHHQIDMSAPPGPRAFRKRMAEDGSVAT